MPFLGSSDSGARRAGGIVGTANSAAKQDRIDFPSLSGARAMDLIHKAQEISMIEELLGISSPFRCSFDLL